MPRSDAHRPITDACTQRVARVLGVAAVVALIAVGCGSPTEEDTLSATYGLPDVARSLEAVTWVLDTAESTPSIATGATITLAFDDDQLHGQAPCNTYRGSFELDGHDIAVGAIATTKIGCDEPTATAERAYLAALEAVDTVDVTEPNRLELTGDDITLRYDRVDLDTAIVGRWDVVSYLDGDAIVSPVEGTEPTIELAGDGTLSLAGGCNPIASTWHLDGPVITVGAARAGLMACDEPPGVMEQDTALAAAIESARRVELAADLRLLDDQDRTVLVATRAQP